MCACRDVSRRGGDGAEGMGEKKLGRQERRLRRSGGDSADGRTVARLRRDYDNGKGKVTADGPFDFAQGRL